MGAKVYSTGGVDVINIDSAGNVGIGTVTGDGTMTTIYGYARVVSPAQVQSAAGSETIDCSLTHIKLKSGGNATITLNNLSEGQTFTLVMVSTGSAYTITWSPTVFWPSAFVPTPTVTANRRDVYTFIKIGGSIYGSSVRDMG